MDEPTVRQCVDAKRVQEQLLHEMNLLSNEGIGPHEMVAGMGSALADVIATAWGQEHVCRWFAAQAELIARMQGLSH